MFLPPSNFAVFGGCYFLCYWNSWKLRKLLKLTNSLIFEFDLWIAIHNEQKCKQWPQRRFNKCAWIKNRIERFLCVISTCNYFLQETMIRAFSPGSKGHSEFLLASFLKGGYVRSLWYENYFFHFHGHKTNFPWKYTWKILFTPLRT